MATLTAGRVPKGNMPFAGLSAGEVSEFELGARVRASQSHQASPAGCTTAP